MNSTVYVQAEPEELYFHIHEIIRLFFPGAALVREITGLPVLTVSRVNRKHSVLFTASFDDGERTREWQVAYLSSNENDQRRLARVFTLEVLSNFLGPIHAPYGILTGIRPTKLVHRMLDIGRTKQQIITKLNQAYRIDLKKAELLYDIACRERPYLHAPEAASQLISIYVGIPYCPSRCFYCSFPATQLTRPEDELTSFLAALQQEIIGVASGIKELGLQVENLYIGGGTPSILGAARMEQLIETLKTQMPVSSDLEFTVEAGRPDTMDKDLVVTLQRTGVNRVCVNPQSMNDATLQRVGRMHNRRQVIEAVELVRAAGIPVLNMDIIVGLPGEGTVEWEQTLGDLLNLHPENITVHTLAAKKGSAWTEVEGLGKREQTVKSGVSFFAEALANNGYEPYYLYRQKNMRSDEENIGFTLPGSACRYNIQVIEERQSIIGLGGGAGSKFVRVKDWTLTSTYNPKNPEVYLKSVDRLVTAKVDKLRALNIE
ncbi:MAG: coproporphyrinogen dehydrogenase HemZ [Methylocystaceae bacterium]